MWNDCEPDIIMRKIKDEIIHSNLDSTSYSGTINFIDKNYQLDIKPYINEARNNSSIGVKLPPMYRMRGIKRIIASIVGKAFLRVAQIITRDQRLVNQNVITALEILESNQNKAYIDISRIESSLQDFCNILDKKGEELRSIEESLKAYVASEFTTVEEKLRIEIINKNQECVTSQQLKRIERTLATNRMELMVQKRRINLVLDELRKNSSIIHNEDYYQREILNEKYNEDLFYLEFEDQFRGSKEDIKARLKYYLPLVKEVAGHFHTNKFIDIGCGRGEWLELLREEGMDSIGIDINRATVNALQEEGYNVYLCDAIQYLHKLKDSTVTLITGFHIIEHLSFQEQLNLLRESLRVLKPGGFIILETPNPKNIIVAACNFYADPTHRHPIHPDTIRFVLESQGFVDVDLKYWAKQNSIFEDESEAQDGYLGEIESIIMDWFKSPPDYAVIGRKP
jgi:2-polyprenyl-3-methyl-5-hydroxy-6-metoxy-1,4-benzoquinol methylase